MCKNYLDDWFGGTAANQQLAQSQAQATQLQQKLAADNAGREARIRGGKSNIDTALARYDPAYYDRYRQDYLNAQNPSIDCNRFSAPTLMLARGMSQASR